MLYNLKKWYNNHMRKINLDERKTENKIIVKQEIASTGEIETIELNRRQISIDCIELKYS